MRGCEPDLNDLVVASQARADIFVARLFYTALAVPNLRADDPRDTGEHELRAPEAASTESGLFQALSLRVEVFLLAFNAKNGQRV